MVLISNGGRFATSPAGWYHAGSSTRRSASPGVFMAVSFIHHVGLPVFDLERAEAFYRDVLGIGRSEIPSYSPGSIVFLACGDAMIHLIRYGDEIQRPGRKGVHWAFEVDDLEEAFRRVVASGCEIEIPVSARPDSTLYFFFYDPEGNRIELCRH
jgi:predicted enzyme related to lactoylglutathione lyase